MSSNKKGKKKPKVDPITRANNQRFIRQMEREEQQSNWQPQGSQPPNVGVIEGTDQVVSFKTGRENTSKAGETLITKGDYCDNNKGFNRDTEGNKAHDHFGPNGEAYADRNKS